MSLVRDDDVWIPEAQWDLLVRTAARLDRAQTTIGHGNFNLLGSGDTTSKTAQIVVDGGAIYNYGDLDVASSTISGNTATSDGGGIFHGSFASAVTLNNTIVSGNQGGASTPSAFIPAAAPEPNS